MPEGHHAYGHKGATARYEPIPLPGTVFHHHGAAAAQAAVQGGQASGEVGTAAQCIAVKRHSLPGADNG